MYCTRSKAIEDKFSETHSISSISKFKSLGPIKRLQLIGKNETSLRGKFYRIHGSFARAHAYTLFALRSFESIVAPRHAARFAGDVDSTTRVNQQCACRGYTVKSLYKFSERQRTTCRRANRRRSRRKRVLTRSWPELVISRYKLFSFLILFLM